jgi:hypothetical protein
VSATLNAPTEQAGRACVLFQHAAGQGRIRQHARALHKAAAASIGMVVGDEMPFGHHVAVKQDQVVTLGSGDRAVARAAHACAVIGLPQVHQPHRIALRDACHQFAGRRLRAIVGDDYLVWQFALCGQRAQHLFQCSGPVVGDHGNTDPHG